MSRSLFTDEQQTVANHGDGHALISAVAGSGKTTTLVERIARLVEGGAQPSRILCLQFGKAAQTEFQSRLAKRLPGEQPKVRTYHSLALAFLQHFVRRGELPDAHIEASEGFWEARARQTFQPMWAKVFRGMRPGADVFQEFLGFVTRAKATLAPPEDTFNRSQLKPEFAIFVLAFKQLEQTRLEEIQAGRGARSYDDMLFDLMSLLKARPELWRQIQGRLDHILVDEFQDTNEIQFELLRGLAGTTASVAACGDADQSIYGFRGSRVEIMTQRFAQTFSPCTRFTLSRTFRYGPRVALLANALINHNRERDDHIVISAPSCPDTVVERLAVAPGSTSGLVGLVSGLAAQHRLHEVLMLVRNFEHALPFEFELTKADIPFVVEGRESLLRSPELAMLTGALHLAAGKLPREPNALSIYIDALMGTPTLYIDRVTNSTIKADVVRAALTGQRIGPVLNPHVARLNGPVQANLARRAAALSDTESGRYATHSPSAVLKRYAAAIDLIPSIERSASTPERAAAQLSNINAFMTLAGEHEAIESFLQAIDEVANRLKPQGDHLRITSIHRAKGAEAPMVIVAGWGGGFPSSRSNIEEERRLAYVAITRAKERLVLIHPHDSELEASLAGGAGVLAPIGATGSRFLYEMDLPGMASVHRALFGGGLGGRCLQPALASRYAAEIGVECPFTSTVPPTTTMARAAPVELPPDSEFMPLTERTVVRVGDFIKATAGARWGVVVKLPTARIAVIRDNVGGEVGVSLTRGLWRYAACRKAQD
jgi:DNA helicase-2/ATP-dependent DNA helicase PcrA